jgi:hypothetical protein
VSTLAIDVGERHPCADPSDRRAHHRVAQIDTDDVDPVTPKTLGDHPRPDAEFEHRGTGDPRCQIVGEVIAAPFATACLVVDVGNTVERGSGHRSTVGHPN